MTGENYPMDRLDDSAGRLSIAQAAYNAWMDRAYSRYPAIIEKAWADETDFNEEFKRWRDRVILSAQDVSGDDPMNDWTLVAVPRLPISAWSLHESLDMLNMDDSAHSADEDKDKNEFLRNFFRKSMWIKIWNRFSRLSYQSF